MTYMAALVRTPSSARPYPPTGGRCAFYSSGRPGDICGRQPVAVYVNPRAKVRRTYRCSFHDRDVAVAEAARLGFVRQAVEG